MRVVSGYLTATRLRSPDATAGNHFSTSDPAESKSCQSEPLVEPSFESRCHVLNVLWQILRQCIFVTPRASVLYASIPPKAFQWLSVLRRECLSVLDIGGVVDEGDEFLQSRRLSGNAACLKKSRTRTLFEGSTLISHSSIASMISFMP